MTSRATPMAREPRYDRRIADLRKNARERLRVNLHEFRNMDMVSLRVFVDPQGGHDLGRMVATQKGVTLAVRLLPKLRAALQAAEREAVSMGLLSQAEIDATRGGPGFDPQGPDTTAALTDLAQYRAARQPYAD